MAETAGAPNVSASAPSQAQTTSNEPEQVAANDPQALVDQRSGADVAEERGKTGPEAGIQFFEGSVAKIDRDGNEVMSDHLAPGERLARDMETPKGLSDERNPAAKAVERQGQVAAERREQRREDAAAGDRDSEDTKRAKRGRNTDK